MKTVFMHLHFSSFLENQKHLQKLNWDFESEDTFSHQLNYFKDNSSHPDGEKTKFRTSKQIFRKIVFLISFGSHGMQRKAGWGVQVWTLDSCCFVFFFSYTVSLHPGKVALQWAGISSGGWGGGGSGGEREVYVLSLCYTLL